MVRRLLLLNGLAAVFAVSHHAVSWGLTAMFWWTDRYMPTSVPNYEQLGGFGFYALRFIDQFAQSPVTAFLFVSGYFVATASGSTGTIGWTLLLNRVKTLVPPYLVWSLVAIALNIYNGETYTISRLGWVLLTGGAAAPFYFVPLLVELYVLSRWLAPLARQRWRLLLSITGIVQLSVVFARSCALVHVDVCSPETSLMRQLLNSQLAAYWFWFALGLVVSQHLPALKVHIRRVKPWLPALLVAVHAVAFVEWETIRSISGRPWVAGGVTLGDNLCSLILLLTVIAFDDLKVPYAAALGRIGALSFGIYLIHFPVLEVGARVIYHVAPALLAHTIVFHALLVLAGVTLPVLLMRVVKASPLQRYYAYAFG